LVEPTTGNTGISLASVAIARGYKLLDTMPSSIDAEIHVLLHAFGAEIVLTDPSKGLKGAFDKAEQIVFRTPNAYMIQQFANSMNREVETSNIFNHALSVIQRCGIYFVSYFFKF
jgi:S-sulfo-L-cysteine synthase (O-acetyl-L-serine-dependent)